MKLSSFPNPIAPTVDRDPRSKRQAVHASTIRSTTDSVFLPRLSELDSLDLLDRGDLTEIIRKMITGGMTLSFYGKRTAMEIAKRVRPRVTRRIAALCQGSPEQQCKNMLIEGENLQAMVTLYKFRGQVDLIVTDPPYNTGQYFRYNDRWDLDPNDPDLGEIVTSEDGSRHTKWMKAMLPRLQMMKSMLKPHGVVAICIDDNELFHLGLMMDEVFGEDNRLALINWQKAHSPKNDSKHVSTTTEYVLVYARDKGRARTGLLPRDEEMDKEFRTPDNDPDRWSGKDPTAREHRANTAFAIQSPFSGLLHYPNGEYRFDGSFPEKRAHWVGLSKSEMQDLLEAWGSSYETRDLKDGRGTALVLKGSSVRLEGYDPRLDPVVARSLKKAQARYEAGNWPRLFFNADMQKRAAFGRPRVKVYLTEVKRGRVPITYWADDEYDIPTIVGTQSWAHEESGHSDGAKKELDAMVGPGHGFDTVKPQKLMKKLIQLWCPPHGVVLDPYAGSGTTGHAVLELNAEVGADRRFILIEQGSPAVGDKYARSLTWLRLHNAITGDRPEGRKVREAIAAPLPGGFEFRMLTTQIDAKTVLSMRRDELVDVVITSHWELQRRSSPTLMRIDDQKYRYLVGRDERGDGYFIVWDGEGPVGTLDAKAYTAVLQDAKRANIKGPYHVYARYEVFQSPNVRFYKIPDKILAHLGLNESSDSFNNEEPGEGPS